LSVNRDFLSYFTIPTLTLPLYTADSTEGHIDSTFSGTGGGFQHRYNSFITAFSSKDPLNSDTRHFFDGNNWYGFNFQYNLYNGSSLEYTGANYLGNSDYKGEWVIYSFEKQYHITGFKIWAQRTDSLLPFYNPARWRLYGSNDNGVKTVFRSMAREG